MAVVGWQRFVIAASLATLVQGMAAGCASPRPASNPQSTRSEVTETARASATPTITLVGLTNEAPQGRSTRKGTQWLRFDVVNSSDASLTLPNRLRRPLIVAADGVPVDVNASSARITNGGGGWGPSAAQLGPPYLNPGGVMHIAFGVAADRASGKAKRPLAITYAPTSELQGKFVVP